MVPISPYVVMVPPSIPLFMMDNTSPWMTLYNPKTYKMEICKLMSTPKIDMKREDIFMPKMFGAGIGGQILLGRMELEPIDFITKEHINMFCRCDFINIMLWLNYGTFMLDGFFTTYSYSTGSTFVESTFHANAYKML